MVFEIEVDKFWSVFIDKVKELYGYDVYPIQIMTELHNYLGLKYISTVPPYGPVYFFKFKVVDKKKFFLIRIKHGI
jgi:hypothetical protein